MGFLRRKVPTHYIPIHAQNVSSKDWIILLEAGTIVGPSAEKLRVAQATLEKKIVKRYNIFLRPKHYLVLDGYDPRIHTLYFCPQLYRFDDGNKLVGLEGEEIGRLVAQAVQDGVTKKRPWYEPSEKLPHEPVITPNRQMDFDSLVVEQPTKQRPAKPRAVELVARMLFGSWIGGCGNLPSRSASIRCF